MYSFHTFVNIKDDDIIIFDVCLTISMCIGSYLWMDFLDFNTALKKVDCFSFFNIILNTEHNNET